MKQKLLALFMLLFMCFQAASQSIGMLGDFNSWGNDVILNTSDDINFTLTAYTFAVSGGVKFREDQSWSVNWGGASFPNGTATIGGPNIPVPAGTYDIAFNRTTGVYSFTAVSAGFDSIGLIGGFNEWATDIPLITTNGSLYTYSDFHFTAPDVKFRKDNNWDVSWGGSTFPMGTAILNGDNIPLVPGFYNVNFNNDSFTYNFQAVPVTMIGPAVQDWNTEVTMNSNDNGVSFTLLDVTLNDGEMKFRANNAWSLNWGGTTFPAGTAAPNNVDETPITVTAGTYNVTFNRLTLEYNFQSTLSIVDNKIVDVKVFPNPSNHFWRVQSENETIEKVIISDLSGKIIYSWNGMQNNLEIPNHQLNVGVYIARITVNQQEKIVKLIKQ